MSRMIHDIEQDIAGLTPPQRALLIHHLIAELDDCADQDVEDAWFSEIQRRYRELTEGSVEPVLLEDAIAQARSNLKK